MGRPAILGERRAARRASAAGHGRAGSPMAAQPRLLSADGTPVGTVQAALNPLRTGLLRAQVAQDVGKIDITYLGPDDLSGA